MDWTLVSKHVQQFLAKFAEEVASTVPGLAMSSYRLGPGSKIFEVGVSFAAHSRDPDDEADLRIFLERAPYETPPTAESMARHRFPPFEPGRDFIWFCVDARGRDIGTLDPVLLPPDRASKEYEDAVQAYVMRAKEALVVNGDRITSYLAERT